MWTWYNPKYPEYLQLEFNRTMLYFESEDKSIPPSNQIAILFKEIESVWTIRVNESKLSENWLTQFTEDKLVPFDVDYENFSLKDQEIENLKLNADEIKCQFGKNEIKIPDSKMKFKLGFLAGEVGLIITANKMKVLSKSGEINLEQIPEIHKNWWNYWELYWAHKKLNKEIPYDPICEITIPANQENIEKIMKKIK